MQGKTSDFPPATVKVEDTKEAGLGVEGVMHMFAGGLRRRADMQKCRFKIAVTCSIWWSGSPGEPSERDRN